MTAPDPQNWYAARDVSTTFAKGIQVLAAFDELHRSLTMPDIAGITRLDRASVRRLVVTLVHLGYLEKSGRHFALTPKVLGLAGGYLRSNRIGAVVQPILNRFSADLDREVSLAAMDGDTAIYIAQSSPRGAAVSFGFTVGSRLPVLHTAIGRMLLACASPERTGGLVAAAPIHPHTRQSLLERDRILEDIRRSAEQGHAFVQEEFEPGVSGLAVPVGPPFTARVVVGTSDQAERLRDAETRHTCLTLLQRCANDVDRALVFPGGT